MTGTGNFGYGSQFFTIVPYSQLPPREPMLFSSRDHGERGNGFPSSCDALAKMPRNINDANNYYITIGLWPWADQRTIKRRCRALLAKYHPEGSSPHAGMFERVEEIYRVLTDPEKQAVYHSVPPGARYIDRFVKKELFDKAAETGEDVSSFVMDPTGGNEPDAKPEPEPDDDVIDADPDPEQQAVGASTGHWDYLAMLPVEETDKDLAQRWYSLVLEAARMFGYQGPIKVLLTHTERGFSRRSSLLRIPRELTPTKKNARELFIWSR